MFTGALPKAVVEQIIRCSPFHTWPEAYVCCSGSFRVERGAFHLLGDKAPRLISNDVSLYTLALGNLALNRPFRFTFRDRLAFLEERYGEAEPIDRVAALVVALEMSRYHRDRDYDRKHFGYYQAHFPEHHGKAREKIAEILGEMRVSDLFAGDWLEHARNAIAAHPTTGAGIIAFPPTYKGGYERLYKFLDSNIEWKPPAYALFDPKSLDGILTSFEESGVPWFVIADQKWEHRPPKMIYTAGRSRPVYGYWSEAPATRTSLRRTGPRAEPFSYRPVALESVKRESVVTITPAAAAQMTYLKDIYLAKRIVHAPGSYNYLVALDGMLVGGIIYTRSKYGKGDEVYLLSDFAVNRTGRFAKLVAEIATSRTLIREVERRLVTRLTSVVTTAFSEHPVSMKYRGVFDLQSRKDNPEGGYLLQYRSAVRDKTPQEIFHGWYDKHLGSGKQQQHRNGGAVAEQSSGKRRRSGDAGVSPGPAQDPQA